MFIWVSDEIRELSDIFTANGEKLYIVGGYVRDSILDSFSTEKNDIDLCSACRPDKLLKILKNTKFSCDDSNKEFGAIVINGEKRYEHTTFRRENYNLNGEHNPTGVEFIKNLREDALRRDFTINAIYYQVETGDIIDPVDGLSHLKNKIIATPISADTSFKSDAERILRMIRFACSLGFTVQEKTLLAAYNNYRGVENLSKFRIRKEFEKMLVCDTFYPTKQSMYAHAKCMLLIGQLNLWQYILPAIDTIQTSEMLDEKRELLYEHIINTVSICNPKARLACLLHDVGKLYTKSKHNNFNFSNDWSDVIIEQNLGIDGLYYPKNTIEQTKRVVRALEFDKNGFASKRKVREFIRDNYEDFNIICDLKDVIAKENTDYKYESKIAKKWKKVKSKMLENKTPIVIKDLFINGDDIIDSVPNIRVEIIGKLLKNCLDYCLHNPGCNNKDWLVNYVKKKVLKNPNYYLDLND